MLRWGVRCGGWVLSGGLWMGKSREYKAKRPSLLSEKGASRKRKAEPWWERVGRHQMQY